MHASLWEDMKRVCATHLILILGQVGFAIVPIEVITNYLAEAGTSPKSDGTVRHYHLLVSTSGSHELFSHGKSKRIPIKRVRSLPCPCMSTF
jgi:hypothetical protein